MSTPAHRSAEGPVRRIVSPWVYGVITVGLAIVLVVLTACGRSFTNSNIEVVNREFVAAERIGKGGVSPKEVESILGPPKRIETYQLELETQKKELNGVRYYYEQDGETLELHFLDDRLISKAPLLNTPRAPAEKPTP
jgi:hypothetical protein